MQVLAGSPGNRDQLICHMAPIKLALFAYAVSSSVVVWRGASKTMNTNDRYL